MARLELARDAGQLLDRRQVLDLFDAHLESSLAHVFGVAAAAAAIRCLVDNGGQLVGLDLFGVAGGPVVGTRLTGGPHDKSGRSRDDHFFHATPHFHYSNKPSGRRCVSR
jgi:hypothetical protein